MPNDKAHGTINLLALAVSILILIQYTALGAVELVVLLIAYMFGTFFLSPDMDINSTSYKRWGFLRILWWPYKVLFKHRGYSHHLILGPLSRLANLALIVVPFMFFAGTYPSVDYIILFSGGVWGANTVHVAADFVQTRVLI